MSNDSNEHDSRQGRSRLKRWTNKWTLGGAFATMVGIFAILQFVFPGGLPELLDKIPNVTVGTSNGSNPVSPTATAETTPASPPTLGSSSAPAAPIVVPTSTPRLFYLSINIVPTEAEAAGVIIVRGAEGNYLRNDKVEIAVWPELTDCFEQSTFQFDRWAGVDSTINELTSEVVMNGDRTVTAVYTKNFDTNCPTPTPRPFTSFSLTTKIIPEEAIDAGAEVAGSGTYRVGATTQVQVIVEKTDCFDGSFFNFSDWLGVTFLSKKPTAMVRMDKDKTVYASYERKTDRTCLPSPTPTVTRTQTPTASPTPLVSLTPTATITIGTVDPTATPTETRTASTPMPNLTPMPSPSPEPTRENGNDAP